MPRTPEIQTVVEQAVAQALERALPRLREEIVRRTTEQLQATSGSGASMDLLNAASASIQEGNSQVEILRKLLEESARFAGRVALFVVKGGATAGWQGIGFEDNDFLKTVSLNGSSGLVAQAMQSRLPASGSTAGFDAAFLSSAGRPTDDQCLVLPLVVKDKVAALIYADGGATSESILDGAALSILNRCTANWLELIAYRKAGGTVSEEPQMAVAAAAAAVPVAAAPVAAPLASAAPAAVVATDDADLHRKAKRFAKLLVEEIKLYNQPKVTEGRAHGDLYERLKEDIEKSRATFDKRYGESPVASANYFNEELIRILADNDISLMGANFPR